MLRFVSHGVLCKFTEGCARIMKTIRMMMIMMMMMRMSFYSIQNDSFCIEQIRYKITHFVSNRIDTKSLILYRIYAI